MRGKAGEGFSLSKAGGNKAMAEHNVKILGFGDNVVDMYEHLKTMYPGGNCVNLCAYAKRFGVEKSAYMGYFGNDDNAEYVIKVLEA